MHFDLVYILTAILHKKPITMRKVLIPLFLLLLFNPLYGQSYELIYQEFKQFRVANWVSDQQSEMTIHYKKWDMLFDPKIVDVYQQDQVVFSLDREPLNYILRDQNGKIACLSKPFTYVMDNGARYERRLKKLGKYIELYDKNEELVARATIFAPKDFKRKLQVKIIKPTSNDPALLALLAMDLLEHFRNRNGPFI